ncbi:MAG: GGDEF domain-containing protein [Thermodesulfovibrio sp.]|nr:GGDEF domain-containing protein [Thermodesulfovibrio sp.]
MIGIINYEVRTYRTEDNNWDDQMSVIEYLGKRSNGVLVVYGMLLISGIGVLDYLSGPELGVSLFYLLPISLITWFVGLRVGLSASFVSAFIWLAVAILNRDPQRTVFVPYWNALVRLGFFIVVVFLQDSLKKEQRRARIDPLTRIGNRRHFFQIANSELERSRRYNRPFTVAYMDLDNFKTVNDTLGHKAGDSLLKAVAATIKEHIRSTDTAARLGGDEFALFLPETEAEAARIFFDKLNRQLLEAMQKKNWPVTFSIGVITFTTSPDSVDDMVAGVDALMYSAKTDDKNFIKYELFE